MRMLDDNEKKIIDEILNLKSPEFTGNLIDPWANNMLIKVSSSAATDQIDIEYGIKNNNPTPDEISQAKIAIDSLCNKIIIALNLLRMLENEGYIILYRLAKETSNTTTSKLDTLGNLPLGSKSIGMNFPDNTFSKLLIDMWYKKIFITPELKRFKKDGYTSRDEQKYKVQRRISTGSLFVAITALVLTTYFNLKKADSPVKIDKYQFEQISTKVNKIETQFVEINKNLSKPGMYSVHDSILLNKITFELKNIKPILTKSK